LRISLKGVLGFSPFQLIGEHSLFMTCGMKLHDPASKHKFAIYLLV